MKIKRSHPPHGPKRVLLIGWDAADWQMIDPLIEKGYMPTLAKLMSEGAWGNLATLRPILSPILWNTVATGKRADQHGVLGFTEPDADATGVRPTSSTSRKCKALWNILSQCGLRSNVVGWYASHPAEPINGVIVSNQFENSHLEKGLDAPLPTGAVHPPELADELASFRVHPREIDASALLPFVPKAAEVARQESNRLGKLQHLISQSATIHAVATHLMANTDWDFTAIYYEGIDRCGHEFMHCHPPKMEQVSDEEYEAYKGCMESIYRFHDMLLETLLKLAGDDTAVVLMSDHGYYNDHLRPDPGEGKAGPVEWHRPFGIIAAHGPGIRAGSRAYGASLLEIAPTVLQLLGLPAAYDMPGRVMAEILEECSTLPRIESWEDIEGKCGMHPPETRVDPAEAQAMLQQLADLGYIEAEGENAEISVAKTIAGNQISLVQAMMDAQLYAGAIEILEQLDDETRDLVASKLLLASCLLGVGDRKRARSVLLEIEAQQPEAPRMHMMLGTLEFADGNTEAALDHFQEVVKSEPRQPGLYNKLGEVFLSVKRYDQAFEAFEKALQIDGENPIALAGMARTKLEVSEPEAALDFGLSAAELVHHFPRVHLVIGEARISLGDHHGAIEALECCVRQAPRLAAAHQALAKAYRSLGQTDKAHEAELRAKGVLA
ncbi:alkaline phosphatase family protein [Bythopirellula goksoeyrii]|uniref:Tetratricopeptide repeat protein n=1 Tax=Bythopirellula goksoeyrii TaxID=1400387 RepID=A0A5B9QIQ1_9BACT|nr:alkaline phosphatase family protein [Bythopirellula goksoeyrii]QEG37440.1 tetratricopeptide repeat protein [Bythopirellula goksoeyrii]